jgi:hypothetical protein
MISDTNSNLQNLDLLLDSHYHPGQREDIKQKDDEKKQQIEHEKLLKQQQLEQNEQLKNQFKNSFRHIAK